MNIVTNILWHVLEKLNNVIKYISFLTMSFLEYSA